MHEERSKAVVAQFDKASVEYLSRHVRPETVREKLRLFNLVEEGKPFQRALDLGCGPGTLSEDLLSVSEEVWGVDSSANMIQVASERIRQTPMNDRIHFAVGEAEKLSFPDEHFDLVFCVGVLRYLGSWEKGLEEIYRVLKPNGVLVATFYYRFSIQWFFMCLVGRPLLPLVTLAKRRPLKECVAQYKSEPLPLSYFRFKKAFSQTGFTQLVCQHSGFEIYPLRRLFPTLSRYLYLKLESAFFRSRTLGWLGSICIVKGVKGSRPLSAG